MPVVKISLRQVSILTALYTIGSAILIVPSSMASIAKQDAWIACLVGTGLGFIILALPLKSSALRPFPDSVPVLRLPFDIHYLSTCICYSNYSLS